MKPNLKIAGPTPRQQLAEAIEHHDAVAAHLARITAAIARVSAGEYDAVENAEAALARAKENESQYLAAVALGEAAADANPVAAASAEVEKAQARRDVVRKTTAALEVQQAAAEDEVRFAKVALDRCVAAVLREEAGAVIDKTLQETAALQEQLGAKRALLALLNSACFEWNDTEARRPIESFLAAPAYPWEWNGKSRAHPALEPWQRAREALHHDADAPLPA